MKMTAQYFKVLSGSAALSLLALAGVYFTEAFGEIPLSQAISLKKQALRNITAECAITSTVGHLDNQIIVGNFSIDQHEVTNLQFAAFVEATGYVTVAERPLDPKDYPGVDAAQLTAGSAVFSSPTHVTAPITTHATTPVTTPVTTQPTAIGGLLEGWSFISGANWQHPHGPDSNIDGLDHYPVLQIAFEDAAAYAAWAQREIPSEQQWQQAAKHAEPANRHSWHVAEDGKALANIWHGLFPIRNTADDGFAHAAPVGCFDANAAGLYDMIGNAWEWTSDAYKVRKPSIALIQQADQNAANSGNVRVIKGGSYLCSGNFCTNYHPDARFPQDATLGTNHIGFRTIANLP